MTFYTRCPLSRDDKFRSQYLQHHLLRAAEADTIRGFDEGAIDEDRVLHHRVEHFFVGDVRAIESELVRQRLLRAKALARRDSGTLVETGELLFRRRILQIFA